MCHSARLQAASAAHNSAGDVAAPSGDNTEAQPADSEAAAAQESGGDQCGDASDDASDEAVAVDASSVAVVKGYLKRIHELEAQVKAMKSATARAEAATKSSDTSNNDPAAKARATQANSLRDALTGISAQLSAKQVRQRAACG